jgi:uncharacterized protein
MSDENIPTDIEDESLERLPIFPLPEAQLFPDAILPLHVFEPRYVEMLEAVLDRPDHSMAIATLKPGYEDQYTKRPPVYSVMGVGSVIAAEKSKDSKWNILVRGVGRIRLIEELPAERAYREVQAKRLLDTNVDPEDPLEERLRSMLGQLADQAEGAREALHLIMAQAENGAALTNLLGAHACSDSALRRRMMECVNVKTRLRMSCQHVGRLLLEVLEPPVGGRETLH